MQALILSLVLACCALGSISAQESVEPLAQLVCETTKGTKREISHLHQIPQLVQFFQGLDNEHKLHKCRNLYLESLEELERVVSVANEDTCGEEKMKLIGDFHRKYVSKVSKHLREQRRGAKAPKMAKLFFMQYAAKVSSICEQNAVSFIEQHQQPLGPEELARVNELRKFTDALGMSNLSKGFKGVYLFWDMVDSLGLDEDKKFAKYLASGGRVRLNVQLKDGHQVRSLQALCRERLAPVYAKSILPVLRLVDLGYYPESQRLLADDPKMRPLFLAAQICETLRPLRVFDGGAKLSDEQFVALTKDEAAKLAEPDEAQVGDLGEVEGAASVAMPSMDELVDSAEAQARAERIRDNVAARSKIVSRMLRNVLKQIKTRLGARLGRSVLFSKGASQELEPMGQDAVDRIDEDQLVAAEEEEEEEAENEDGSSRRLAKRSKLLTYVGGTFAMIVLLIIYAITLIFKVVILAFPTLLLAFTGYVLGDKQSRQSLKDIWS